MVRFRLQFKENTVGFEPLFTENNLPFNFGFKNTNVVEIVTSDHSKLTNRDLPDQHPISAISNLTTELDKRLDDNDALTNLEIYEILRGAFNG